MKQPLLLLSAVYLLSACSSQRDECARLMAISGEARFELAEKIAKKKGLERNQAMLYCANYLKGGGN